MGTQTKVSVGDKFTTAITDLKGTTAGKEYEVVSIIREIPLYDDKLRGSLTEEQKQTAFLAHALGMTASAIMDDESLLAECVVYDTDIDGQQAFLALKDITVTGKAAE